MLGHLIATVGHTTVWDGKNWLPSGMYQEIEWPNGPGGKIDRTHMYKPDLDPNSMSAYLGGAQVVVEAVRKLAKRHPLADIVIIGARPPSMERRFPDSVAQGFTEAQTMREALEERDLIQRTDCLIAPSASLNTEGDTNQLFDRIQGYERVTYLAMEFRLPRCQLLCQKVAKERRELDLATRINFVSAETWLPEYFDWFVEMNGSQGYRNVMSQEAFGVKSLMRNLGLTA